MLKSNEIADNMLNDMQAYKENIKDIIIRSLDSSPYDKAYWDAWFRGAKGKELEHADNGKIYKYKQLNK